MCNLKRRPAPKSTFIIAGWILFATYIKHEHEHETFSGNNQETTTSYTGTDTVKNDKKHRYS